MTKEELKALLEGEEKQNFTDLLTEMGLTKLDNSSVENYLKNTDTGKSLLFSINDKEYERRHKKYMEEGGFAKDFEKEYQKKNPQLTEEQKKIRDLEVELNNYKKAQLKANNIKQLGETANKFGLPSALIEHIVGEDLEASKTLLETIGSDYSTHFTSALEKAVNERLGATPKPSGDTTKNPDKELDTFDKILNGEII